MISLELSLVCEDYPITQTLKSGQVIPRNIRLTFPKIPSWESYNHLIKGEVDICEMSLSTYVMGKTKGLPLVAIPVFPRRMFPHSFIYCNVDSKINDVRDIVGKRVGIGSYQVTLCVWVRGLFQHEYGVKPEEATWLTTWDELIEFNRPSNVKIEKILGGTSLETLLLDGTIDVCIHPDIMRPIEDRSPKIIRFFKNFRETERSFYEKTKIFPIMHLIVIKEDLVKEHPWLPSSLLAAFREAKERCFEYISHPWNHALIWGRSLLEEQRELFGFDPWPYNVAENQAVLETFIKYQHEQGLIDEPVEVTELFHESVVNL